FFIPSIPDYMVKNGMADFKVIPTSSKWFGVTYVEDKPIVHENISKLVSDGVYPTELFSAYRCVLYDMLSRSFATPFFFIRANSSGGIAQEKARSSHRMTELSCISLSSNKQDDVPLCYFTSSKSTSWTSSPPFCLF